MQSQVESLARRAIRNGMGGVLVLLALLLPAPVATAGPITPDVSYGRYLIAVNDGSGVVEGFGGIGVDADGRLYLGAPAALTTPGWEASISTISGQADPALNFAIVATNLGVDPVSFNFSFSIPVALSGTIVAHSALTYGLASPTSGAITIAPTGTHILTAFEEDTDPGGLGSLNKGLDIGTGLSCLTPTTGCNSGVFVGSNVFTGDLAYDLMVVNLGFTLSPGAEVSMAGFVEQVLAVAAGARTGVAAPARVRGVRRRAGELAPAARGAEAHRRLKRAGRALPKTAARSIVGTGEAPAAGAAAITCRRL